MPATARPWLRHAPAALLCLLAACGARVEPPAPTSSPAAQATVVVQRGDTLLGIARRHGVPLSPLAAANGLSPPYRIHPGQVLTVPGAAAPPRPPLQVASAASPAVAPPQTQPLPALDASLREAARGEALAARSVTAEALAPPSATLPEPPPPQPAVVPAQTAAPQAQKDAQQGPGVAADARNAAPIEPPAPPREAAAPSRRMPPGRFAWPVRGRVVSGFGDKGGGLVNDGMNIAAPRGTPVVAAADGTVIYAGNEVRGFGYLVLLRHDGGWVTAYAHNETLLVRQGQTVRTGQEIARVGSTGAVASPQLHFQVRRDGKPVDPAARLERMVAGRSS